MPCVTLSCPTHIQAFLASHEESIDPLELISVRHMREILYCVRELYCSNSAQHAQQGAPQQQQQPVDRSAAVAAAAAAAAAAMSGDDDGVGDVVDGAGGLPGASQAAAFGVAPEDARPGGVHGAGASWVGTGVDISVEVPKAFQRCLEKLCVSCARWNPG